MRYVWRVHTGAQEMRGMVVYIWRKDVLTGRYSGAVQKQVCKEQSGVRPPACAKERRERQVIGERDV